MIFVAACPQGPAALRGQGLLQRARRPRVFLSLAVRAQQSSSAAEPVRGKLSLP